jgi:hypothetical protein
MYGGDVAQETRYIRYVASTAVAGMSRVDAVHLLPSMYGGGYCDVAQKTRYLRYVAATTAAALSRGRRGTLLTLHVRRLLQCRVEDAVLPLRSSY